MGCLFKYQFQSNVVLERHTNKLAGNVLWWEITYITWVVLRKMYIPLDQRQLSSPMWCNMLGVSECVDAWCHQGMSKHVRSASITTLASVDYGTCLQSNRSNTRVYVYTHAHEHTYLPIHHTTYLSTYSDLRTYIGICRLPVHLPVYLRICLPEYLWCDIPLYVNVLPIICMLENILMAYLKYRIVLVESCFYDIKCTIIFLKD
jgi:hypothetical protein